MFDHIQVKVENLSESSRFYQAVLGALGYGIVLQEEGVIGFGNDQHDMFEVRQSDSEAPLSQHAHIAFVAKSEEDVHEFYRTALEHGAKDNGKPGLRPEYEDGYFAAFVIDPNGHNLEAVYNKS